MGTHYSAKMLVVHDGDILSLLHDMAELEEYIDYSVEDLIDELELSYASPWYDAPQEDWTIGFEIDAPFYRQLADNNSLWWDTFNSYASKLTDLFGKGNISLEAHQDIY